jgi:hypothetical protein
MSKNEIESELQAGIAGRAGAGERTGGAALAYRNSPATQNFGTKRPLAAMSRSRRRAA